MDLSIFCLPLRGYILILHSKINIKQINIAMKKLLLLFAVLLSTVSGWAQESSSDPVIADGVYTIDNTYNGRGSMCYGTWGEGETEYFALTGITLNGYTGNSLTVSDASNKHWYVKTVNGITFFYNIGKGVFMQEYSAVNVTCGESVSNFTLEARTANGKEYTSVKSGRYYLSYSCGWNPSQGSVRWLESDEAAATLLSFTPVEESIKESYSEQITSAEVKIADYLSNEITVVYSFTLNEVEKLKQEEKRYVGDLYPNITVAFPWGISTPERPSGRILQEDVDVSEKSVTKVIPLSTNTDFPFDYADSYASIEKWYYMVIHDTQKNFLYHDANRTDLDASKTVIDHNNKDAYTWAFVGNPIDGFQVVNKSAGENMILSSSAEPESDDSYPVLTSSAEITGNSIWDITRSSYGTNGFFMAYQGTTKRLNKQNERVCYWLGGADGGSTFMVMERDEANESISKPYDRSYAFWGTTSISIYPKGLNNTEDCGNNKGNASGHVGVSGHSIYKKELIVDTKGVPVHLNITYNDGNHAISPLGVDLVNNQGVVVSSDYHLGFSGSNPSHFKNDYSLEAVAKGTYLMRIYVCDQESNHELDRTKGTLSINFASENTSSDAKAQLYNGIVAVADEKIRKPYVEGDVKYGVYSKGFHDALSDARNAATADNMGALVDVLNSEEYTFPATGSFYRLKNQRSNNYMSGNDDNLTLLTNGADAASTIFFLDSNNELLSYNSALYLDCSNKGYATVGTKYAGEFDIACNGPTANTIMYKNNSAWTYGAGANGAALDKGTSKPTGNNTGYNWVIEPVETLPFTFKKAALGFATFNAPVAVELPEGVLAYITDMDEANNVLQMYRLEGNVVPAETPVMLYYEAAKADDAAEETTIDLVIVDAYTGDESGEIDEKNDFVGTVAAKTYPTTGETVYSLQKKQKVQETDPDMVGFYKKASDTTLGGFKAWIMITEEQGAQGRAFTIIFDGDDATGLKEALGLENENVEIYDLSGRRLDKPAKGVNVIGGKLVIK